MSEPGSPLPRVSWAVYLAPRGAPGDYYVRRWSAVPGKAAERGKPAYAPTLFAANNLVPAGLTWFPRTSAKGEPANLLGVWREPRTKRPRRKRS